MRKSGVCEVCHTVQPLTPNENIRKHPSPLFPGMATKPPSCKGSGKPALLSWDVHCPGCSCRVLYVTERGINDHMDDGSPWSARVHDAEERCDGSKFWADDIDTAIAAKWGAPAPEPDTVVTSDGIRFSKELLDDYPDFTPAVTEMVASMQAEYEQICETPRIQGETQIPYDEPPTVQLDNSHSEFTPVDPPPPVYTPGDLDFGAVPAKQRAPRRSRQPLEGRAAELASQMKEAWWASQARSERSLQARIGPSEVGHECERRIAYKLSSTQQVNHGKDPWAAWVGTQIHAGLELIFRQASGDSGRYLVETKVVLPSALVPGGTTDLFDRRLHRVIDHKSPGESSLSHMWLDGPSVQYQTQLHVYGYGLKQLGETVEEVALVGWPREKGSLDDLYAWVADYDEQIALDAIARTERIGASLWTLEPKDFPKKTSFLCKWCPYYLPNSQDENKGCTG